MGMATIFEVDLGNKDEVLRLWGLEKNACKRCINRDYMCMLVSLVRLGDFEEAEKVLKEWEMSGNCYDFRVPQTVVVGYSAKGLYERAEALLENLMEKGKATTPKSWEIVAAGYVDKGDMEKAFKCMKVALYVWTEEGQKPNGRVITTLLSWLGDECRAEDVEAFVGSLRKVIPVHRQMYHALLKAYIRGGEEVNSVVDRMKTDKIDHDEETRNILDMRQETSISKITRQRRMNFRFVTNNPKCANINYQENI